MKRWSLLWNYYAGLVGVFIKRVCMVMKENIYEAQRADCLFHRKTNPGQYTKTSTH